MSYISRNYEAQGGSTWVIGGYLEIASSGIVDIESGGTIELAGTSGIQVESGGQIVVKDGGNITASSGGHIAMPVTSCTSTDAPIPNYGMCIIRSSAAVAGDMRFVAAPTRAGLELNLVSLCAHSGVNVCVASVSSNVDVVMRSSGVSKPIWELVKTSTQDCRMISGNTSEWYVIGEFEGTMSSSGSSG